MLMNVTWRNIGIKKILPFAAAASMPAMFLSAEVGSSVGVEIDPDKKFQKIEYFGASDAWSTQYVGDYWRVNLGGGSLEGDESPIKFPWRGARSFIDPESGKIDMSRCIGLRYFMEKAKGYGCENFLLFSNTPPIGMTKNSSYHKTEPDEPKRRLLRRLCRIPRRGCKTPLRRRVQYKIYKPRERAVMEVDD